MEDKSSTLALMKYSADRLKELGADVYMADVKTLNLPIFSYKAMKGIRSEKFRLFITKVKSADGFIFASPEYHGTVSSAFKNTIDFLEVLCEEKSTYLGMKPIGCIALGGAEVAGYATLNAMMNIVQSLRGIYAPGSLAIGYGSSLFNKKGELINEQAKKRLERLSGEVYLLASKLKN